MSIRKDYTVDVLRMLDHLKEEINRKKHVPFINVTLGLKPDDLVMTIEKIRATMPREMKDAASLTRETERIMSAADEEAQAIINQAKAQADKLVADAQAKAGEILETARTQQAHLVDENEILRIATSQADEVRAVAEKDSREMRRGADKYAYDVLNNLENVVGRVLSAVEKGRQELEVNETPTNAVVEMSREKVKV